MAEQAVARVGGSVDSLEMASIVESCVLDTSHVKDLDQIRVCPALKMSLEALLSTTISDGPLPANGILLFGRPGTGKTTLVEGLAKEYKYTLYALDPSTIYSKRPGDGDK